MQFIHCKVTGHFALTNSDWFPIDDKITTIIAPAGRGKSTLLKALHSINPCLCRPDPAPFDDYPRYVQRGGHTRAVDPAKKTAVIAIFICDDPLRELLTAIDPVLVETDRIEVGRRLDGSRWITFVEIAASSSVSELLPTVNTLCERLPRGDVEPVWQECMNMRGSERIKGRLAGRLNRLLDGLEKAVSRQEERELLLQARTIVNREARFAEARETTGQALPAFIYLDQGDLLSPRLDMAFPGGPGGQSPRPGKPPSRCLDMLLLELLRSDIAFFRQSSGKSRKDTAPAGDHLREEAGARLCGRLGKYLPHPGPVLSLSFSGNTAALSLAVDGDGTGPEETAFHWHRMVGWAVATCYFTEKEGKRPVLLLDEPAHGLAADQRIELEAMLRHLSDFCQIIVSSSTENFLAESSSRLRLDDEGNAVPLSPAASPRSRTRGTTR